MPKVKSLFLDDQNEVCKWIRIGLIEKGISQKELAKRIGSPVSTLQYKMADPGKFRMSDIWKIERVIGPFRGGVRSA